jgi:hypothetical protein
LNKGYDSNHLIRIVELIHKFNFYKHSDLYILQTLHNKYKKLELIYTSHNICTLLIHNLRTYIYIHVVTGAYI